MAVAVDVMAVANAPVIHVYTATVDSDVVGGVETLFFVEVDRLLSCEYRNCALEVRAEIAMRWQESEAVRTKGKLDVSSLTDDERDAFFLRLRREAAAAAVADKAPFTAEQRLHLQRAMAAGFASQTARRSHLSGASLAAREAHIQRCATLLGRELKPLEIDLVHGMWEA